MEELARNVRRKTKAVKPITIHLLPPSPKLTIPRTPTLRPSLSKELKYNILRSFFVIGVNGRVYRPAFRPCVRSLFVQMNCAYNMHFSPANEIDVSKLIHAISILYHIYQLPLEKLLNAICSIPVEWCCSVVSDKLHALHAISFFAPRDLIRMNHEANADGYAYTSPNRESGCQSVCHVRLQKGKATCAKMRV